MGCVSSNDVKEIDPPIEKAESAQNHTIPEIQINGPSNSPSKENGLASSPNHHTTPSKEELPNSTQLNGVEEHPSEKGDAAEPPEEVSPPPPMFPHVSPFKPQFDFKRDVTLSPRASKYFEVNGVMVEDDGSAVSTPDRDGDEGQIPPGHDDMGMTVGEMDGKDVQQPESPAQDESTNQIYPDENSSAPKADEESDVPTTTTPRSTEASQTHRPPSPAADPADAETAPVPAAEAEEANSEEKPLLLDDVNVDLQGDAGAPVTATTTVTTDEEMATAAVAEGESEPTGQTSNVEEEDEDKSSSSPQQQQEESSSNEPTATKPQLPSQVEDRSAILASFLDHQEGPEVLGSDEDDSPFPTRPEHDPEFLANQVDDDAMELSKAKTPPLLVSADGSSDGAAGDSKGDNEVTSVLKRHQAGAGGNGDVEPGFSDEEKAKLNELLHEIESIAEKNGYFDK